jgi:hypothetical protein
MTVLIPRTSWLILHTSSALALAGKLLMFVLCCVVVWLDFPDLSSYLNAPTFMQRHKPVSLSLSVTSTSSCIVCPALVIHSFVLCYYSCDNMGVSCFAMLWCDRCECFVLGLPTLMVWYMCGGKCGGVAEWVMLWWHSIFTSINPFYSNRLEISSVRFSAPYRSST